MERLILCGGGHISLELAHIAARLNFSTVVIDDRAEFANAQRFPMADAVLAQPFLPALAQLGGGDRDFFCILTRGHAFDRDCLAQILRGQFAYVGMIGSRGKVAAVLSSLREDGVDEGLLAQVHAPIGLPIGGSAPAEIAVSIAAQLVQVRAQLGPLPAPPPDTPGVLCTIAKKQGSAPRGVGTWMLVQPDGTTVGTVGGGAVEHQVRQDALALWHSGQTTRLQRYDLSPGAAQLGMVCGGEIVVSFSLQR